MYLIFFWPWALPAALHPICCDSHSFISPLTHMHWHTDCKDAHWRVFRTSRIQGCLQRKLFWLGASIRLCKAKQEHCLHSSPSSTIMPGTCILLSLLCKPQAPSTPSRIKTYDRSSDPESVTSSSVQRRQRLKTSPSVVTCGWVTADLWGFFLFKINSVCLHRERPLPRSDLREPTLQSRKHGQGNKEAASGARAVFISFPFRTVRWRWSACSPSWPLCLPHWPIYHQNARQRAASPCVHSGNDAALSQWTQWWLNMSPCWASGAGDTNVH